MKKLFEECQDVELRDKLLVKMLTELSHLPSESFASELPNYMDLDMLGILKEKFDLMYLMRMNVLYFQALQKWKRILRQFRRPSSNY